MITKNFIYSILACLLLTNCSNQTTLNKIEGFKPPKKVENTIGEPYDSKLKDGDPVPKSLTDALAYDIWIVLTRQLELTGLSTSTITTANIETAINEYNKNDYKSMIGIRPYTHSCFIKSLTKEEQSELITDLKNYINKNGVWEKPAKIRTVTEEIIVNPADTLISK